MRKYDLITPEGTKDFLFEECLVRRETEHKLHAIFRSKGYSELTTPGLEFFDVFQSESGHYPQERLYKMTDSKGRLLVLRPESTMPIARVVATRLRDASLPLRLYYNQSVYRFEPALKGRSDEITQTGIELLGSASYMADVEMITTAIEVLSACSNDSFSLELGDAGVFKELMRELNATPEERENIRYLIETKNYPALNDVLDTMGDSRAAAALKKLPALFGGEEVFEKASQLYSNQRIDEILMDLRKLYEDLSEVIGAGRLTVDLGMVNNADYYTGVIIKGYLEGYGEEVLSGGRYNKLLSDFGYDIPATGFAVNVDAVSNILRKNKDVAVQPADAVIYAAPGYEMKAVTVSQELRAKGQIVEYAFFDSIDLVREYAKDRRIGKVVIVDEEITEVE
ncbi:ATP phosphoribosyltransferase regulatory subunit [Ruminococcus sp.]|uniref:ATP phosphoribosyltransferase regulatory subunit n=1 Tax=Ruminococcus sp. TaxID=41978 RepID=UPI0025E4A3FB|nr:ATP phosphoribosyltransferase regulatory subunit [Ruminococcus sp.]